MEDKTKEVIEALKTVCIGSEWWEYLQEDVHDNIEIVMDNLLVLGQEFRDAFLALFKYEKTRRKTAGLTKPESEPSCLFGTRMTEEHYLCGIAPTKALLCLNDWSSPNEADVYACIVLCKQIDAMELLGIFPKVVPDNS